MYTVNVGESSFHGVDFRGYCWSLLFIVIVIVIVGYCCCYCLTSLVVVVVIVVVFIVVIIVVVLVVVRSLDLIFGNWSLSSSLFMGSCHCSHHWPSLLSCCCCCCCCFCCCCCCWPSSPRGAPSVVHLHRCKNQKWREWIKYQILSHSWWFELVYKMLKFPTKVDIGDMSPAA